MKSTRLFQEFFNNEKSGGLVLIFCTIISLVVANTVLGNNYQSFWQSLIGSHSIQFWINDGLMAIFFLLIGLELKREIYQGELANVKDALLPIFAALGGIFIPAGIYLAFNFGTITQSGAGIPMATDIAFALGVLSLLGSRVPLSLKVFLTALATIDDLGAILVIAIFYSGTVLWLDLLLSLLLFGVLLLLNHFKVKNLLVYIVGGGVMWYFMSNSGVNPTITGILLAFTIPFGKGEGTSLSNKLEHWINKPVAFIILPVFALANTAITLGGNFGEILSSSYSLGISAGLVLGKPLGIFLFSYAACRAGWCKLPNDLNWKSILNVGFLGGIGFTMSIFITLLAFEDVQIIDNAKLVILLSSLVAGGIGFFALKMTLKKGNESNH